MSKVKTNTKIQNQSTNNALDAADPNLYFGNSNFLLPNGDSYEGEFCAHRKGLIWRHGRGIYTTKDGHVYEGKWKQDRLEDSEIANVHYPSGAEYTGLIVGGKCHGPGVYRLECQMDISCEFADNKPTGSVALVDFHGRLWTGESQENSSILLPENHFYNSLPTNPSTTAMTNESSDKNEDGDETSLKELTDQEWQNIIFSKSVKISDNINIDDDEWCRDYLEFRRKRDAIKSKIEILGLKRLPKEDQKWDEEYEMHKKRRDALLKSRVEPKKDCGEGLLALEEFHSEGYRKKCEAVSVIYPSSSTSQI